MSFAAAATALAIVVYPNGIGKPPAQRYALRCAPAAGTVPKPALACRTLAALDHPLAPVPPGTTCSQIALGPEEAIVTGRVGGQRLWVRLRVRDSCEIERWRRIAAVVPGFPGHS